MYRKTVLDNGLRIVTSAMPHTRSVCVSLYIGAGSRYEEAAQAGVSHFLEHLLFKGTQRRATAKEVSEAIEGVGGVLNGGTDRELTVYWAKVARPHFPLALDVLVDMLRHSKLELDDVEKERQIIIEEINMTLDSPHQRVDMLIDEVVWPNQPLGRDVAGTKESIQGLTQSHLQSYLDRQYTPSNTVVSVAGNVDHQEVAESIDRALGDWPDGSPHPWYPAEEGQDAPRLCLEHRRTEQAHLCVAIRGLSALHPDRFILDLLNVVLGEGMSSRLFLEIRERRGLAYDIYSYVSHFLDSGAITIYAGVDPRRAAGALEAILEELARLRDEVPPDELEKVKELSKGRLLLRMEDTRSVAGWLGVQGLLMGRIRTVDEVVAIIDAITTQDMGRVAQGLVVSEKLNLAVVGPFRSSRRFRSLLRL